MKLASVLLVTLVLSSSAQQSPRRRRLVRRRLIGQRPSDDQGSGHIGDVTAPGRSPLAEPARYSNHVTGPSGQYPVLGGQQLPSEGQPLPSTVGSIGQYDLPHGRYQFNWNVADGDAANYGHKETRDGDVTRGSYTVALPDGRLQIVNYSVSEETGYVAEVTYQGEATYPEGTSRPDGRYSASTSGGYRQRSEVQQSVDQQYGASGQGGQSPAKTGYNQIQTANSVLRPGYVKANGSPTTAPVTRVTQQYQPVTKASQRYQLGTQVTRPYQPASQAPQRYQPVTQASRNYQPATDGSSTQPAINGGYRRQVTAPENLVTWLSAQKEAVKNYGNGRPASFSQTSKKLNRPRQNYRQTTRQKTATIKPVSQRPSFSAQRSSFNAQRASFNGNRNIWTPVGSKVEQSQSPTGVAKQVPRYNKEQDYNYNEQDYNQNGEDYNRNGRDYNLEESRYDHEQQSHSRLQASSRGPAEQWSTSSAQESARSLTKALPDWWRRSIGDVQLASASRLSSSLTLPAAGSAPGGDTRKQPFAGRRQEGSTGEPRFFRLPFGVRLTAARSFP